MERINDMDMNVNANVYNIDMDVKYKTDGLPDMTLNRAENMYNMRHMEHMEKEDKLSMKNRCELMKKISKCGFYLHDLALFLDTHPTNRNALALYVKHQNHHSELVEEYEDKYGPLTPGLTNTDKKWNWVDGPWPWERDFTD